MLNWLRGLRAETKPIGPDPDRIVVKSSERGEPPCERGTSAAMTVRAMVSSKGTAGRRCGTRNDGH